MINKPTEEEQRYWERVLVNDGLGMWVGTTSKLTHHNLCSLDEASLYNDIHKTSCTYTPVGQMASLVPYANKLRTGWHHSDAVREGMKGNKHHLGCKHTEATKAKISAAKKGKPHTQEHKDKISAGLKASERYSKKKED